MLDPRMLIGHWGYIALCGGILLGNIGLPVPEETILVLSGYLAWKGSLRLPIVLFLGILSAVTGDNVGYWTGRKYGPGAIERYGRWIQLTPERLKGAAAFVSCYGPLGVFVARFIPGLRFLGGPLAGATGLRPQAFVAANVLGAMLYVPLLVGAGYAVGYGFGAYITNIERLVGKVEYLVLVGASAGTLGMLGWRRLRVRRPRDEKAG